MSDTAKGRTKSLRQKKKIRHHAASSDVLVIGFAVMILVGTVLLMSPAAARRQPLSFVDALFTATSAVCVTGLSVFDPGSTLTLYGQIVLLVLIQCGGLGFMTLSSVIMRAAKHRSSLHSRIILKDAISAPHIGGIGKMAARILTITLVCEATGAILFMIHFVPRFGLPRGAYYSIFHSISSFCNAGFDVFGTGNNLIGYQEDVLINVVTMALIIIGGLGFFVILELGEKLQGERPHRKLTLHTRIVLIFSTVLILGGAIIFMMAEWDNPATLGAPHIKPGTRVLGSFFQSVSTRTAGFMTFDQGAMRPVSKIVSTILMVIGASPAGTAGGLKTTTIAILAAFVWSVLQGKKTVVVMKRTIPTDLVYRAAAIFSLGMLVIVLIASGIVILEPTMEIGTVIFETASAFGTVGLSTGITSSLSDPSLILLILTMFGGRLGIFTVTLVLARRLADQESVIGYPEEKVLIG